MHGIHIDIALRDTILQGCSVVFWICGYVCSFNISDYVFIYLACKQRVMSEACLCGTYWMIKLLYGMLFNI